MPIETPESTPLSNKRSVVDSTLRFGSHLFVNPEDTPETMRFCVGVLDNAGFKLIRLFVSWSLVQREPDNFSWRPITDIFDEAHNRGMKIVATLMSGSPPGWMKLTRGVHDSADLDDPGFSERSIEHVRTVVHKFRDHPALDSWILWNEPARQISTNNKYARKNFQKFIAARYGSDVAAYNAEHYVPITSFEEADPGNIATGEIAFVSHRTKVEWIAFTLHDLQEKLSELAREVRALDGVHPIHVNPHQLAKCMAEGGQSIWQEAEVVDFMGCSAHAAWHSVRFPRARYGTSIALFADLTRSATLHPDGHFWVTELQAGTTLMSGFVPLAASPQEARVWLWQAVAAGAKAVVYWCAHARTDGYEAGEWDLFDFHDRPTPRLETIGRTIRDIQPHLPLFSKATAPRPDVGILVSEAAHILDLVEGSGEDPRNPRNRQRGMDAVLGAYLIAADLSLEVGFYELGRLSKLSPASLPRILLAPSLTVIDEDNITYLEKAVATGCLLIGDGFFAWKDAYGRLAQSSYALADHLWGAVCSTYEALEEGYSFEIAPGDFQRGWFVRAMLNASDAKSVCFWPDGIAAFTRRQSGKGVACRIGTFFFQDYFAQPDAKMLAWFHKLTADHLDTTLRLANPSATLRLRRLQTGDGEFGILINSDNKAASGMLTFPNGRSTSITVPAQDARVILQSEF
jgi:beta-galactosidase